MSTFCCFLKTKIYTSTIKAWLIEITEEFKYSQESSSNSKGIRDQSDNLHTTIENCMM